MISVYVMIQYRCSACHVTGKELKMLNHETVLGNRIGKGVKQSEMFNYSVYSRLGNNIICFEQKYKNSKMNSTENCHFTAVNKKLAASKAYGIPPATCRSKRSFVKIIFSALNFFMHIFNMSVTYLPCIKRIH